MHLHTYLAYVLTASHQASSLKPRSSSHIAVTPHVLPLLAASHPHPITPSSAHLHKRRSPSNSSSTENPPPLQQDVLTLGGCVYMTNITLSSPPRVYTLILDTGSSDTWLASSTFRCVSRASRPLLRRSCGFGTLFDARESASYVRIPELVFGVRYSDGEFLSGEMGVEELGFGGGGAEGWDEDEGEDDGGRGGTLRVRQTIGVAERGWWMGDGRSSGLMGMAYPTLASHFGELGFAKHAIPPIFSLALARPTPHSPTAGGLLALGGIPDVPITTPFVSVPIHPILKDTYAFYSIPIDGFAILPPAAPSAEHNPNPNPAVNPALDDQHQTQTLTMIIDSGSTHIYLPDATADRIAALAVPPARYRALSNTYQTVCGARMPRVGVVIGGSSFFVADEDMLSPGGRSGAGGDGEGGAAMCTLAVQRMGGGDAVLGDAFLKSVLVVFDVGGGEMRFAGR